MQLVPCAKCAFCMKRKAAHWTLRLQHEMAASFSAFFVTLTYNDEHLPRNGYLSKDDLQKYLMRLRKINPGLRYFAVGEYGGQGDRPHYHLILFNVVTLDLVHRAWSLNGVALGYVCGRRADMGSINYCVEYIQAQQRDKCHPAPPFVLMSRRPGIGSPYVKKMGDYHRETLSTVVHDFQWAKSMPRYYKDKFFTDPDVKALIQERALAYNERNPKPRPSEAEHERLLKRLYRKLH